VCSAIGLPGLNLAKDPGVSNDGRYSGDARDVHESKIGGRRVGNVRSNNDKARYDDGQDEVWMEIARQPKMQRLLEKESCDC